jgi:hypothetical protein
MIKEYAAGFCETAAKGIRVAATFAARVFWLGLLVLLTEPDLADRSPTPEPEDRDQDIDDDVWQ